jgi:hypothetical protein
MKGQVARAQVLSSLERLIRVTSEQKRSSFDFQAMVLSTIVIMNHKKSSKNLSVLAELI